MIDNDETEASLAVLPFLDIEVGTGKTATAHGKTVCVVVEIDGNSGGGWLDAKEPERRIAPDSCLVSEWAS
jgi:hypothetical protein